MHQAVVVRVVGVVAVLALGMLIGRSVFAKDGSITAVTARNSGALEAVRIVGSDSDSVTTSTTFGTLTSTTITVPAGQTDLITADFFGYSACYLIGGAAGSHCYVRLRAGNVEMHPQA